jgi:hypothetical protein
MELPSKRTSYAYTANKFLVAEHAETFSHQEFCLKWQFSKRKSIFQLPEGERLVASGLGRLQGGETRE